MTRKTKVASISSGNIGTDLMMKVIRLSDTLELAAMIGIDPASDGRARATAGRGKPAEGIDGLMKLSEFAQVGFVFDAPVPGRMRDTAK